MKKILIFFSLMMISCVAFAVKPEKQYRKLVEKYDVCDEAKSVERFHPTSFWQNMLDHNKSLAQFRKDIKKNRGAEKETFRKTSQLYRFNPRRDESVVLSLQGFCDTLLINTGIADLNLNCSLHVVYSDEVNAFTALTDNGFAMCLTAGLFIKDGLTYDMLMGFVAHEFAHGVLMHHMRAIYAEAKERRKNELLAGIAGALNGIAAGANAYFAGMTGTYYDNSVYYDNIANLGNIARSTTLKYSFRYSRDQEYEADLIAFRFLQNMGCEEALQNGLALLGCDYDFLYSEYSDHPTIMSRIEFLQYVQNNPSLKNENYNYSVRRKR